MWFADCPVCHLRLLLEHSTNQTFGGRERSVHLLRVRSGCPWDRGVSEAHYLLQEEQVLLRERVAGSLGCGSGRYKEEESGKYTCTRGPHEAPRRPAGQSGQKGQLEVCSGVELERAHRYGVTES